jgi:hypothetical protein
VFPELDEALSQTVWKFKQGKCSQEENCNTNEMKIPQAATYCDIVTELLGNSLG